MLYDNALLSRIYLDAYLVTSKDLYRRITEETLDYVVREITSPEGGFLSRRRRTAKTSKVLRLDAEGR